MRTLERTADGQAHREAPHPVDAPHASGPLKAAVLTTWLTAMGGVTALWWAAAGWG